MTKGQVEKKVRDLLIPLTNYPHMPYWASLKEAMVQLTLAQQALAPGERRRTVLVFDEAYKLQGVLNQKDILRGIEPSFARSPQTTTPLAWEDLLAAGAQEQAKKAIKEFMSPVGHVAQVDDSLIKASHVMLADNLDLLPVMDGGKVLGVVRLEDIFHEISLTILAV